MVKGVQGLSESLMCLSKPWGIPGEFLIKIQINFTINYNCYKVSKYLYLKKKFLFYTVTFLNTKLYRTSFLYGVLLTS